VESSARQERIASAVVAATTSTLLQRLGKASTVTTSETAPLATPFVSA
jgi:hypothetical protein